MLLLSGGTPRVESGLEVLVRRRGALLRGRRVALLAHQASVDSRLTHAAALLADLPRVRLVRLFAPEHGLWGAPRGRAPARASLRGLDALVIDLQDVGARYYTFAWTLALALRACARARVPVVVCDRPNPLGGVRVEGNLPDPAFASFVGLYPLPARHGLTLGELARYLNGAHALGSHLTVDPMRGWRRAMLWEDTGLPWVAPSPNMPTPDTARVYPGGCLFSVKQLLAG